ncbi:ATP-binding cassette domain-containing protein [Micromonospora soli]|uniref:ABC transporter ATP-binding protein n=1 Tax=Micromonospora sp. NBRC 110009 TaxID=3061627 RepID=UPI0026723BB1|nr:ATP-binding cassette domain-containing protein [Micromonospora sp. NBRC 110009]WKT98584.1 ATP-binding cassette domain-containing protein [Micromonospora sp. NBRC 110009]
MPTLDQALLSPAPEATPRIAARAIDVMKTYGSGDAAVRALDGASVTIPAGQFTAVMGPSGSGKSTLVHALAGLDTIDSGRVFVGDTDLTGLSERDRTLLRRARLGFVFQAFNLIPSLTAAENIALPFTLTGKRPDPAWLAELVAMLSRCLHRQSKLPGRRRATSGCHRGPGQAIQDRTEQRPPRRSVRSCAIPKLTVWEPPVGASGADWTGRTGTDRVVERPRTRTRRTGPDGLDMVLGIYGSEGRRCLAVRPAVQPSGSATNDSSRHAPTVRPGTRSSDPASTLFS